MGVGTGRSVSDRIGASGLAEAVSSPEGDGRGAGLGVGAGRTGAVVVDGADSLGAGPLGTGSLGAGSPGVAGTDAVPVGSTGSDGSAGSDGSDGSDGLGAGPVEGDGLGEGEGLGVGLGAGPGRVGPARVGLGAGRTVGVEGRGRWDRAGSPVSVDPRSGGPGRLREETGAGAGCGTATGSDRSGAGWTVTTGGPASGAGTTTGPAEGGGMKTPAPFVVAVLPTVADPALIAARIGIDAVPASSATVKR